MEDILYDVCNDYTLDPSTANLRAVRENPVYRWTPVYRSELTPVGKHGVGPDGLVVVGFVGWHTVDRETHYFIGAPGYDGIEV